MSRRAEQGSQPALLKSFLSRSQFRQHLQRVDIGPRGIQRDPEMFQLIGLKNAQTNDLVGLIGRQAFRQVGSAHPEPIQGHQLIAGPDARFLRRGSHLDGADAIAFAVEVEAQVGGRVGSAEVNLEGEAKGVEVGVVV